MRLIIEGVCPSLKNSKKIAFNRKTGQRFVRTEDRVKQFMDSAKNQIKNQWQEDYQLPVSMTCIFYFPDKRRHDLDNALATICDCVKEFLGEDNQFYIEEVVGRYGGIDKVRPRAEIWID